jgi:hypothetical protein
MKNLIILTIIILPIAGFQRIDKWVNTIYVYSNGTTYGAAVENESLYIKSSTVPLCTGSNFACFVSIPTAYILNPNATTLAVAAPNVEIVRIGNAILAVRDASTHTPISGSAVINKPFQ